MAKKHRPRDRSLSVHHLVPTSRGGGARRNLVLLPVEYHNSWHRLFANMTVEEVHTFIDEIMQPDGMWDYKALDQARRRIMGDE